MSREEKLQKLIDLGVSIREKLDKRGFHGHLEAKELAAEWTSGNRSRVNIEVIGPMYKFIRLFENLPQMCDRVDCNKDVVYQNHQGYWCKDHG